jgi:hypothetical protein
MCCSSIFPDDLHFEYSTEGLVDYLMSCFACFIFVSTIVDYFSFICIIQYKICEQLHAIDGLSNGSCF